MISEVIILQNGRVIDPMNQTDGIVDIWLEDGRIVAPRAVAPRAHVDTTSPASG